MPNNIVDTIHRLAAASKQAGGITFTNKNGNIITVNDDKEDKNTNDDEHISITNNYNGENTSLNREKMRNEDNDQAIIGVNKKTIPPTTMY